LSDHDWLAQQFEENRGHLRGVAYRMLGSVSEAEDAVQESWLRLSRTDSSSIDNLGGWLTTVTARVCLDMLRSRKTRREDPVEEQTGEPVSTAASSPEQEAIMADAVGAALLVVLDRLSPAERLAFVLHDLFAISFEEIGGIVGKTATAARQLASRARRRVQGAGDEISPAERPQIEQQRALVTRFITALRAGDVPGLVAVLDPEFVLRVDAVTARHGGPREIRGAETWAKQAVVFAKGAPYSYPAMVDGAPGLILAPQGRLQRALRFHYATTATGELRVVSVDVIGDLDTLAAMELGIF
jgi:RNA polymerase sigma factor (sigma-70 family)